MFCYLNRLAQEPQKQTERRIVLTSASRDKRAVPGHYEKGTANKRQWAQKLKASAKPTGI